LLTVLRAKDGTSEPAVGQEGNYKSITTPDNSGTVIGYQELEMSRP